MSGPTEALARGWSIIPCGRDKKPILDAWKPYQTVQPTEQEVSSWAALKPAAWAIITGAISGRITLDFDGEPGRLLVSKLGLRPHRSTPSGGFHVDFKHPGWRVPTLNHKSKRELGARWPGLDIRADGGYVLFTGRIKRGEYAWLRDPEPYELDILPEDLRDFLGLLKPPEEAIVGKAGLNGKAHRRHAQAGRVGSELLTRRALDRAKSEGRNNAGFWLACQARDNGYSEAETRDIMRSYAARVCNVNTKGEPEPYTEAEARATLREAYGKAPREPWELRRKNGAHRMPTPEAESTKSGWKARLLIGIRGGTLGNVANALTALRYSREWQGVLRFNASLLAVIAKGKPPFEYAPAVPFQWSDEHDILTAAWLQHQGIPANKEIASQAVQTVAREHCFHPIRDYLDALHWDGIKRIDDWLTLYLGAEPSDYVRAVGDKWLISGVARIYEPGCKVDTCIILEGPQGNLKSTALRTLAKPWFIDDIADLGSKDSMMQMRGVWIIELSELDAMSRPEVSRIKSFMSRPVDHFRPPYGMRAIDVSRECIFAGTVNHDTYLKDETGSRRFWPVKVGRINLEELSRDRDQLWAEACERFRAGEKWWLEDQALVDAAAEEAQARYDADPWQPIIEQWIDGREYVTVEQILEDCLKKLTKDWTQSDKNRIARCLRAAGWARKRDPHKNDHGKRPWRYWPSPSLQGSVPGAE